MDPHSTILLWIYVCLIVYKITISFVIENVKDFNNNDLKMNLKCL